MLDPLTLDFLVRLGLNFHPEWFAWGGGRLSRRQFFCHGQKRDYLSRASQRARGTTKKPWLSDGSLRWSGKRIYASLWSTWSLPYPLTLSKAAWDVASVCVCLGPFVWEPLFCCTLFICLSCEQLVWCVCVRHRTKCPLTIWYGGSAYRV